MSKLENLVTEIEGRLDGQGFVLQHATTEELTLIHNWKQKLTPEERVKIEQRMNARRD